MRHVLKFFLFNLVALFGAAQLVEGFSFGNDLLVLAFSAIVFGTAHSFLKPILKAVTLPFNLLTLGLFSLVIDAFLLYLTARVVPGVVVAPFYFGGLYLDLPAQAGLLARYPDIAIPALNVPVVGTFLLTAVVISVFAVTLGVIFGDE